MTDKYAERYDAAKVFCRHRDLGVWTLVSGLVSGQWTQTSAARAESPDSRLQTPDQSHQSAMQSKAKAKAKAYC